MSKLTRKVEEYTSKKPILKWGVLTVASLSMGVGVVFAFNIPGFGKGEKMKPVKGMVAVPVDNVSDGKAHFYRVFDDSKEIGFFVVKGSDGAIHTAFDACDVCFNEKKGYVQQGNYMVCKNCNKKFAVTMIGPENGGGCNPSHLAHIENGGKVIIKMTELKSGARFF